MNSYWLEKAHIPEVQAKMGANFSMYKQFSVSWELNLDGCFTKYAKYILW